MSIPAGQACAQSAPPLAADEKLLREEKVPSDGPGLVEFFRRRGPRAAERARIAALVRQLGDRAYKVRQRAEAELVRIGRPALPFLRAAAQDADLELWQRARLCIAAIKPGREPALVRAAARALAARRSSGATTALLSYVPLAPDAATEEEVLMALAQLGSDPALAAALTDAEASRRAAAALVLGRVGTAAQRERVYKLLADPDGRVRLRAAQGLVAAGDPRALPPLATLASEQPGGPGDQARLLLKWTGAPRVPGTRGERSDQVLGTELLTAVETHLRMAIEQRGYRGLKLARLRKINEACGMSPRHLESAEEALLEVERAVARLKRQLRLWGARPVELRALESND
jgi:HEAT repeat protein